ncbi:3'-5' exonuclease [Paenibacillus polymyxa]|uniref:3'-5' exonuclease n=1 Tax=Paenibacillus polymyxa TaxID=1406 RepID=UPI0023F62A83|nr:3'-5' exonuclease [Paenibacillus polymyxa]
MISQYTYTDSSDYPVINTIHSAKGKDLYGVMVVSSQGNTGSAHWKQWIKNEGEARRIGYVASTRAKYFLIWAVPTLKREEKVTIKSYGSKPLEINLNDVGGGNIHTDNKDEA